MSQTTNRPRRPDAWSLALPLLAVLLRLWWLRQLPDGPIRPVDALGYHTMARNVIEGRGLSLSAQAPFCPTALRMPLYPLFVAGGYGFLGTDPRRIVLLHLLLEALTTVLVTRLGREVAPSHKLRAGRAVGLLYACNGTTQLFVGTLLTETLLYPLVAAALWRSVALIKRPRPRKATVAGALWGLAILVKPNALPLALCAGLLATLPWQRGATQSQHAKVTLPAFTLALALTLAPWLVRNRQVMNRWLLTTAFAENSARVSAVATLAQARGLVASAWDPTWTDLYANIVDQAARRAHWDPRGDAELPCREYEERHRQIAAEARRVIREHPLAFAAAHLQGVLWSLVDFKPELWYPALTGRSWVATSEAAAIGGRLWDHLRAGAIGEAARLLWEERVVALPFDAFAIWWGLIAARLWVAWRTLVGAWRLRDNLPVMLLLLGTVAYHVLYAGPIAHARLYAPGIPATVALLAVGVSWREP